MAYVMGEEDGAYWDYFVKICCKAYNILRKHSKLFITLFAMMLSTGLPQLKYFEDLYYLRSAFAVHLTDAEAADRFRYDNSLTTLLIHLLFVLLCIINMRVCISVCIYYYLRILAESSL